MKKHSFCKSILICIYPYFVLYFLFKDANMEVFKSFVDKVASLVRPPDFSAKGPHRVVGLDGFETFIGWKVDASFPTLEQARRLAKALQPIVETQGCTIGIETATSVSPDYLHRSGLVTWQLVVSPGESQSVDAFEFSLQTIAATLEDPSGFAVSPEKTELQVLVPRFSQAIRSAVATNKHSKYRS